MMKLDFIVIGAAKSGTTALHETLKQINKVSLFQAKDIHFFDHDEIFTKGKNWYWEQFAHKNNELTYGEVSANYLYSNSALSRIKSYSHSSLKVIVLLRDPLERLLSEYKHHVRNGLLNKPLSNYLNNQNSPNEGTRYKPWHLLVERSCYADYIKNLESNFPKQNIKIISTRYFQSEPQNCINELCEFINVKAQTIKALQANKAFTPRSTKLMFTLTKGNIITKTLKFLIPSFQFREKIRQCVIKMNTSTQQKERVTVEEIKLAKDILTRLGAYAEQEHYKIKEQNPISQRNGG